MFSFLTRDSDGCDANGVKSGDGGSRDVEMADASTTPQNNSSGNDSGAAAKKMSSKSNRELHVGHFALNHRRDDMEVVSPFNHKTGLYVRYSPLTHLHPLSAFGE